MKSLFLLNVFLLLLIASYHPLFSGNTQTPLLNASEELVRNVEANSFSSDKVQIRWEINSIDEDLIFFVQKSTDGVNFLTFGSLRASSSKSYAFFDHLPQKNARVFYRVKVVSVTEDAFSYLSRSAILEHNWDSRLYSSQNESSWTFKLPQQIGDQASLLVLNSMGQMVLQQELSNIYSKSLNISTQTLIRGTYLVLVVSGGNQWTTRIFKN